MSCARKNLNVFIQTNPRRQLTLELLPPFFSKLFLHFRNVRTYDDSLHVHCARVRLFFHIHRRRAYEGIIISLFWTEIRSVVSIFSEDGADCLQRLSSSLFFTFRSVADMCVRKAVRAMISLPAEWVCRCCPQLRLRPLCSQDACLHLRPQCQTLHSKR